MNPAFAGHFVPITYKMSTPATKKKIFKLKVAPVNPEVNAPTEVKPEVKPDVKPKPKKVFTLKKPDPVYTITDPELFATEAFIILRDYCASQGKTVTKEDIQWYQDELEREKKELAGFWDKCSVTKACLDAFAKGSSEEELEKVEKLAKLTEKKEPLTKDTLGEKPPFGTPEFWAWARKSKQLRLQEEAAIIAAGGTVKTKKTAKK